MTKEVEHTRNCVKTWYPNEVCTCGATRTRKQKEEEVVSSGFNGSRKDRAVLVTWNMLVSACSALAAVWVFAAPLAQNALAGEIQKQIQPIVKAQIITITSTIENLRNSITAMEYKRDMCARQADPSCWTQRDAQDLDHVRTSLIAAEAALKALTLNEGG